MRSSVHRLATDQIVNVEEWPHELLEIVQVVLARGVAERLGRVRVRLDEDAVDTSRHARARERVQELPRAALRVLARDAVLADRVADVEHHRIADLAEQEEAARVDYQIVVP